MKAKAKSRVFALWIYPVGTAGYGLRLCQASEAGNGALKSGAKIEQIKDDPLKLTLSDVIACLKRMGHKSSDLQRGKTTPFRLNEEEGVRLAVLFMAVKPLRKIARIEAIAERVRAMAPEELYYWYSKSTDPDGARRARHALRVLIANEA